MTIAAAREITREARNVPVFTCFLQAFHIGHLTYNRIGIGMQQNIPYSIGKVLEALH
jgi:hypothetical protein